MAGPLLKILSLNAVVFGNNEVKRYGFDPGNPATSIADAVLDRQPSGAWRGLTVLMDVKSITGTINAGNGVLVQVRSFQGASAPATQAHIICQYRGAAIAAPGMVRIPLNIPAAGTSVDVQNGAIDGPLNSIVLTAGAGGCTLTADFYVMMGGSDSQVGDIRLIASIDTTDSLIEVNPPFASSQSLDRNADAGCSEYVTYLTDVIQIGAGDTWTVEHNHVYRVDPLGHRSSHAVSANITSTGIKRIPIANLQNYPAAQIHGNGYRITRTVNGGTPRFVAKLYRITGGAHGSGRVIVPSRTISGTDTFVVQKPNQGAFRAGVIVVLIQAIVGTWDFQFYADAAATLRLAQRTGQTTVQTSPVQYDNPPWQSSPEGEQVALPPVKAVKMINTAGASPSLTYEVWEFLC